MNNKQYEQLSQTKQLNAQGLLSQLNEEHASNLDIQKTENLARIGKLEQQVFFILDSFKDENAIKIKKLKFRVVMLNAANQ